MKTNVWRTSLNVLLLAALFTLMTGLFFWRVVLQERYFCWGDVLLAFWPWRVFSREMFLEGVLPLWNPFVFCGYPFAANPQTGLFYPLNLLTLWIPAHQALTWIVVFHVLLSGLFMMLYLRVLGCSYAAQVIGSCAYAFSGSVIARLQFVHYTVAFACLPCLLLLYELRRDRPDGTLLAGGSVVVGLMLLGTHPQLALIVLTLCALYVAWDCGCAIVSRDFRLASKRFAFCLAAIIAGIALAAIQLVPEAELLINSNRSLEGGVPRSFAIPPWQLIVWIIPNFFGNPEKSMYWGEGNFFEVSPYVGVAPLLLACYASVRCRHRLRGFLIGLFVMGIFLGMGDYAPFYKWASSLFPILGRMRGAGRWLILSTFAVSVLAAIGWGAVASERDRSRPLAVSFSAIAALLGLAGVSLVFATDQIAAWSQPYLRMFLNRTGVEVAGSFDRFVYGATQRAGMAAVESLIPLFVFVLLMHLMARFPRWHSWGGCLAVLLVFGDLFWFGSNLNPTCASGVFTGRQEARPEDGFRIATPQTYIKDVWKKYVSYHRFVMPETGPDRFAQPIALYTPSTNMVSGIYNAEGYDPIRLKSYEKELRRVEGEKNLEAWGEFSVKWVFMGTTGTPERAHFHEVMDPLPRAYLTADRTTATSNNVDAVAITEVVNRVHIQCPWSGPSLVMRDVWYPGWNVYNDGAHLRMVRDGVFRAVPVTPAGRVVFVFQSTAFIVGGALSFLTAGSYAGAIAAARIWRLR